MANWVNLPPSSSPDVLPIVANPLTPLLLLALLLPAAPARSADVVPWLYEVAVPVADQSDAERSRASGEALLLLLTRLTGLAYVPRTPEVTAALGNAEGYYSEFSFAQEDAAGLKLVVQFDQEPVLALIRAADLPIWRARRERVLVWVVIQEAVGRSLVGAASELPLVGGIMERARDRGLPLTLPLLDLEDQVAVDPAAVWGRLSQVVDPASRRYGADVLLLRQISTSPEGDWLGDWEFWVDGVVVPFATRGADLAGHGRQAVDVLANELAARRVIHGRETGLLAVSVAGVRTPADYGGLLRYLQGLEFIQRVAVSGIHDGRLWLRVDTPADPERLLAAFQRDRKLFDDRLARLDAADLRLVWHGGG